MRSTEHSSTRPTRTREGSGQLAGETATGHADTVSLATIAITAARLAESLDELRVRQPDGDLAGPNPNRVTLDQAAAAAADLHALVASLITEHG